MSSNLLKTFVVASDADEIDDQSDLRDDVVCLGVEPSLYGCCLCKFNAKEAVDIVEHIRTHSREAPWNCWKCSNERGGDTCDQELHDPTCPDLLERDEATDLHEDLATGDPDKEHKCTLCTYKSQYLHQVVEHIKLHMRKRRQEMEDDELAKTWDNIYTCTQCEFSCVRPDKLEKHMSSHGPDACFKCRDCADEFTTRKDLQRHKRTTHGFLRPFECTLCLTRFTRMDNLRTHIANHSGQRRFLCKHCSFASTSKARLSAHYASHKDGNPRKKGAGKCPICGRAYSTYSSLVLHLKTHFVSPPYSCVKCSVTFDSPKRLFEHQMRHVDAAVVRCAFCDFRCFDDSTMHNHLGVIHRKEKPFQCQICDRRFSSIGHWKRHQLVHTGEKPYSCELCQARFSQSGNRKAHMLKLHNVFIPLAKGQKSRGYTGRNLSVAE